VNQSKDLSQHPRFY